MLTVPEIRHRNLRVTSGWVPDAGRPVMADDRSMTDEAPGTPSGPRVDDGPRQGWIPPRFGLVRPKSGRQVAGVCTAIGQATGTDPVLWRVTLAVLTLFGGIGAMTYLVGWLLLPEEGDEVSPVEALLGRGRSATSAPVAVLLAAAVGVLGIVAVTTDFGTTLLFAGLVAGAVLLINRNARQRERQGLDGEPPPSVAPQSWPDATYRPPFSPHGPYAPTEPAPEPPAEPAAYRADPLLAEAERLRSGAHLTEPVPGQPVATEPAAFDRDPAVVPVRRRRSALGRVTIWSTVVLLGVVGVVDLTGAGVSPSMYFATALATVGLGLLVGTWFGRARGLIALGAVLAPLLLAVTLLEGVNLDDWRSGQYGSNVTWAPTSVTAIEPHYEHGFGNAELDLRGVDFTDQTREVKLVNLAGNTSVLLPPDVDTKVRVAVTAGNATVFGTDFTGVSTGEQVVSNAGDDGPGGGDLVLRIEVKAGNVEVLR